MLATVPMIGLLVTICFAPGATPAEHVAAPATAVHPPSRTYDDQLPALLPALSATAPSAGDASDPTASSPALVTATVPDDRTLAAVATDHATGSTIILAAGDRGIPARVLTAYRGAAVRTATEQPACHLSWPLLAGIGEVESGHAAGHRITADGTLTRAILGPPLDGHDGRALIPDTDHGILDHDRRYDRAVGPMQFIPTTWTSAGRDNSGDGHADPENIDDATLAAAGYLCRGHRDLADATGLRAAIYSYNPSASYVHAVLAWTAGYTTTAPVTAAAQTPVLRPVTPVSTPPPPGTTTPTPTTPPTTPPATSPAPGTDGTTSAPPASGPSAPPSAHPAATPSAATPAAPTTSGPSGRPVPMGSAGRPTTTPIPRPVPIPTVDPAAVVDAGRVAGDPGDVPLVAPSGPLRVIPLTPAGDGPSPSRPATATPTPLP